jgi:hypothetical protein
MLKKNDYEKENPRDVEKDYLKNDQNEYININRCEKKISIKFWERITIKH